MNGLYDYISYYKNASFEEIKFNTMDALIFSMFSYLPISQMKDGSSVEEVYSKVAHTKILKKGASLYSKTLLKMIRKTKRYEDIKFYNKVNILTDEIQFGALTIRFKEGTFISYEGSDASISAWKENFYLSCRYPTMTQIKALQYLKETIRMKDQNLYIGGHSKGGNLAMSASMEAPISIWKKIRRVYNFDGPGFRKEQFLSNKFQRMSEKLYNVIPDGSLVGIILNNTNYHVIKTSGVGIQKHYPEKWHIFGEFFVENELAGTSEHLQNSINQSVEKLQKKDMEHIVNTFFELLEENQIRNLKDFKNLKFSDIRRILSEEKSLDPETKKCFMEMLKIFLNFAPAEEK